MLRIFMQNGFKLERQYGTEEDILLSYLMRKSHREVKKCRKFSKAGIMTV